MKYNCSTMILSYIQKIITFAITISWKQSKECSIGSRLLNPLSVTLYNHNGGNHAKG